MNGRCLPYPLFEKGRIRIALLCIILCFFETACAPFRSVSENFNQYIDGVPFFPHDENYCGPASLASVLGFRGEDVSLAEITKAVFSHRIKGAINVDMVNFVKDKGYEAVTYRGDIEALKREIDRRNPVIIYLKSGFSIFPRMHYVVVVGYDEQSGSVIVYSGKKRNLAIEYNTLLRSWKRTGFWTMIILPAEERAR